MGEMMRSCAPEVVPVETAAADFNEALPDLASLNALSDHSQIEGLAHREHCSNANFWLSTVDMRSM
jgi:hypothetical protein